MLSLGIKAFRGCTQRSWVFFLSCLQQPVTSRPGPRCKRLLFGHHAHCLVKEFGCIAQPRGLISERSAGILSSAISAHLSGHVTSVGTSALQGSEVTVRVYIGLDRSTALILTSTSQRQVSDPGLANRQHKFGHRQFRARFQTPGLTNRQHKFGHRQCTRFQTTLTDIARL